MRAAVLGAPVPERLDMYRRCIKGQLAQHQVLRHPGLADEMTWHDAEQIGVRNHPPGGEELVHRQYHSALAVQRGQGLVDEAPGTARKAHQQVARVAIAVHRQAPAGQWVLATHDADVLAAVQALVRKRDGFAGLLAGGHVRQGGREVADGHVGGRCLQQSARVARGQRHHTQRNAGRIGFRQLDQTGDQGGCGSVGHGQNEGGGGARGLEVAGRQ